MHKDMMRSMRLPDSSRRIDHEAARAAVRPLQGVLQRVDRPQQPAGDGRRRPVLDPELRRVLRAQRGDDK